MTNKEMLKQSKGSEDELIKKIFGRNINLISKEYLKEFYKEAIKEARQGYVKLEDVEKIRFKFILRDGTESEEVVSFKGLKELDKGK